MRACSYAWSLPVETKMAVTPFHPSAISKNPMLHSNLMTLCFIEPEFWPMEVLRWRNGDFRPLPLWSWPVFPECSTLKLSSDKQTKTTEIIKAYHAASRMVKNSSANISEYFGWEARRCGEFERHLSLAGGQISAKTGEDMIYGKIYRRCESRVVHGLGWSTGWVGMG